MKKLAIILAVVMLGILAWTLWQGSAISVTMDGRELEGPLEALVGLWGIILAAVILFCVAILLAFVFAGVGLIVIGSLALVGIVLAAVALPFLLPLLIPLFIVWAFCAGIRRGKRRRDR